MAGGDASEQPAQHSPWPAATRLNSRSGRGIDLRCSVELRSRKRQRETAVGDRERMGSDAATVITIGRALFRTYLAGFAQDGW